jgi:hypothetical protein
MTVVRLSAASMGKAGPGAWQLAADVTMQVAPRPHGWQDLFPGIPNYFYNVE